MSKYIFWHELLGIYFPISVYRMWGESYGNMDGYSQNVLGLNSSKLESELKAAARKDERYWNENDAKIRAIEQRVATYDEFRQLVAGCELKVLDRNQISQLSQLHRGWNNTSKNAKFDNSLMRPPKMEINMDTAYTPNKFIQTWREIGRQHNSHPKTEMNAKRFQLLDGCSQNFIEALFASGLGLLILSEILECLSFICNVTVVIPENSSRRLLRISELLWHISTSTNASVTRLCLTDGEQANLKILFDVLQERLDDSQESDSKFTFSTLRMNWGL